MTHAGVRVALQLQPSGQGCTSLDARPFRSLGADCRSTPSLGRPLEAQYRSPLGGAHEQVCGRQAFQVPANAEPVL